MKDYVAGEQILALNRALCCSVIIVNVIIILRARLPLKVFSRLGVAVFVAHAGTVVLTGARLCVGVGVGGCAACGRPCSVHQPPHWRTLPPSLFSTESALSVSPLLLLLLLLPCSGVE